MRIDPIEERAAKSIEGGVLGFHRLSTLQNQPAFAQSAKGCMLRDVADSEFIDFVMGKGPIIVGHAHARINEAVLRRVEKGNLLSITPVEQFLLAEKLLDLFPWCQSASFHKTGSDACSAAVRLARASTGRALILSSGYHGWHDWCSAGAAGAAAGLGDFFDFGYRLEALHAHIGTAREGVAAIIVEPLPGCLDPSFYAELRQAADAAGCWLIFDEVKSGFRTAFPSVQHECGVKADAVILSKAIANGYCVSAILGSADFMQWVRKVHVSSTMDIEAIPYAAALATLDVLSGDGVLQALCTTTQGIVAGLNGIFENSRIAAKAFVLGSSFRIAFADTHQEEAFYSGALEEGILLYPFDNQFICLAHTPDIVSETLARISRISARLPPAPGAKTWDDICHRELWQFTNRKGFLDGFIGSVGR
jgi:glutamate-1-semialdehyde aminotransferase